MTHLVDVRLNPCSSDPTPGRPYGPKPWNLQAGAAGIVRLLAEAGIAYTWLVELGNPQRQDRSMAVLRDHLADTSGIWPVHRGLDRLAAMVREGGRTFALLCTARTAGRAIAPSSPRRSTPATSAGPWRFARWSAGFQATERARAARITAGPGMRIVPPGRVAEKEAGHA